MKNSKILIAALIVVAAVSVTAYATSNLRASVLDTPGTSRVLDLPPQAANSHVISLGEAVDPETGKMVEGYMFIYKKDEQARPDNAGGSKNKNNALDCYESLGGGAHWISAEPYMIDSTNRAGLDGIVVETIMDAGITTWETEVSSDIFGTLVANTVDGADQSAPDGKNEVLFADISSQGTIGVTTVWGVFKGKPADRVLVEWDMVFDDYDFEWSAQPQGVAGKMDFFNIAAHELGHALGLGHPNDGCTEETMFRYASEAEIKKRDLNTGDIAGVQSMY